MTNTTANWFSDKLPFEIKERGDGMFNVWHMRPFQFGKETELKWYVAHVAETKADAERFIAGA